ncbi:hypothetical protein Taro_044663 [Colocasia esculenta]|uniref:Uncharacterized protein n=1 Tax=Colocasia esculenta TaxID=4460 RepID=A0A843WJU0_COLES|nr:hypothetical protein [Colocasia esculenta]
MGFPQQHYNLGCGGGGGGNAGGGSGDGVSASQCISSPRYTGNMTRRAQSFKRGHNGGGGGAHEIELQINSPRSSCENPSSPIGEGGGDAASERRLGGHLTGHQTVLRSRLTPLLGKDFLKKPTVGAGVEFGLRERKKLGNLMFFCFCGVCLLLGLMKICAPGWVGFSASDQDISDTSISVERVRVLHEQEHWEGSDGERTLMTITSSIDGQSSRSHSGIWAKPNSENFTQCIDQSRARKSKVDYAIGSPSRPSQFNE